MPAVDFKAELVAAVWTKLNANSTVTTTFKAGNRQDVRTDGRARQRLANRAPADFPSLAVDLEDGRGGGVQQRTPTTPTFGVAQAVAGCDPIIPVTVPLKVVAKFDTDKLDSTAAETAIRASIMSGYPKLGLAYVRMFTVTESRERDPLKDNILTVTFRLAIELRLYASQMVA